jgi:hypothetical protein
LIDFSLSGLIDSTNFLVNFGIDDHSARLIKVLAFSFGKVTRKSPKEGDFLKTWQKFVDVERIWRNKHFKGFKEK